MSIEKMLGLASIRWPVAVLITDTVPLPVLATYIRGRRRRAPPRQGWCPPRSRSDSRTGPARRTPSRAWWRVCWPSLTATVKVSVSSCQTLCTQSSRAAWVGV